MIRRSNGMNPAQSSPNGSDSQNCSMSHVFYNHQYKAMPSFVLLRTG